MKNSYVILFAFICSLPSYLHTQDMQIEGGQIMFKSTEAFPQFGTIRLSDGDIEIEALGTPNGRLTIADEAKIGINQPSPSTGLHMKQLDGTIGEVGLRLENSTNTNHWTIEFNKNDNHLDFYYNGQFASGIETNGDYNNPNGIISDQNKSRKSQVKRFNQIKLLELQKNNDSFLTWDAESIKELFPEVVYDKGDDMLFVSQRKLLALTIGVIQEQHREITKLSKKINELNEVVISNLGQTD